MSYLEIHSLHHSYIDVIQTFIGENRRENKRRSQIYLQRAIRKLPNCVPQVMTSYDSVLRLRFHTKLQTMEKVKLAYITEEDYRNVSVDLFRIGEILNSVCHIKTPSKSTCMVLKIGNEIHSLWVVDLSGAEDVNVCRIMHSCSWRLCNYYRSKREYGSKIACVIHVGNIDVYERHLHTYLKTISQACDVCYFFTVNDQSYIKRIKGLYGNINIRLVENRGMDIGPFLLVLSDWKEKGIEFDFVFKIHTKSDTYWRTKMCDCLFGSAKVVKRILWIMRNVDRVGMIGSKSFLLKLDSLNTSKQMRYCKRLGWGPDTRIYNSKFIGGTIFCIRWECLKAIMNGKENIEDIVREFQKGYISNTVETNTHAWERLLGICVGITGYDYLGV